MKQNIYTKPLQVYGQKNSLISRFKAWIKKIKSKEYILLQVVVGLNKDEHDEEQ